MRANRVSAVVFATAVSLAGCMGTSDVEYAGEVRVTSPELVEISPGVQVLADAEEPLFYSEGYYWLYRDGYWLRSDDYRRGFVRVELSYVPQRVRGIERPQTYVQYRRHHARDYQARANQRSVRSRPAPQPTDVYRTQPTPTTTTPPPPAYPPPNQGVPSTPGAATPGVNPVPMRPQPTPGVNPAPMPQPTPGMNPVPTRPQPTPPITSPSDVRGTPMPPHRVPPPEQDEPPPTDHDAH